MHELDLKTLQMQMDINSLQDGFGSLEMLTYLVHNLLLLTFVHALQSKKFNCFLFPPLQSFTNEIGSISFDSRNKSDCDGVLESCLHVRCYLVHHCCLASPDILKNLIIIHFPKTVFTGRLA